MRYSQFSCVLWWPDRPQPFLTVPAPKIFNQFLIFTNLYQHAKIQFIPSVITWDTVNVRVLSPDWLHPFFTTPTPNIFNHLLICANSYQYAKNQFIWSIHSWDKSILKSMDQIGHTHIATLPNQKNFRTTIKFCKFVSTEKNGAVLSISFRKIVDLKILQTH